MFLSKILTWYRTNHRHNDQDCLVEVGFLISNTMLMRHVSKRLLHRTLALPTDAYIPKCTYSNTHAKDILNLYERGVFCYLCPDQSEPQLENALSTQQTVYCGFDPTAESLHVGNLLAIIGLLHFQRAGHTPIALVGGATAHIGDPSGKTSDRPKMDAEIIENNILGITENLERIFTNHEAHLWRDSPKLQPLKVLNNMAWYENRNLVEFLSDIGRHFRMGHMLAKHSVRTRLESPEGMNFTEFTYQIFQANDWLHLYRHFDCKLQIGGNDQQGNIVAGMDLLHKVERISGFGLAVPLLTTSTGHKFGKTEKYALWLNPDKTTPYELYQYFLNTSDDEVEKYLKLFTFLPDEDIADVIGKQQEKSEARTAQKLLAENLVTLVHGEKGLQEAERWTKAFFSENPGVLGELTGNEVEKIFSSTPAVELLYDPTMTVFDLALKINSKSFRIKADVVRIIKAGGFYINYQRVTDPEKVLIREHDVLPNNLTLIRVGKKSYHVVKWIYN